MDTSTLVNIVLCILSFVLAAISVVTVIITLRQNSLLMKQNQKMVEESIRPIISVYTQSINPGVPMLYLIVKNFGNSPAYMEKFNTDFDFSKSYGSSIQKNYIEELSRCTIAPGQSKTCFLDHSQIKNPVHFSIQYKSSTSTYSEEFDVDLIAASGMPTQKYATPNKELLSISYSLQEMLLKNL